MVKKGDGGRIEEEESNGDDGKVGWKNREEEESDGERRGRIGKESEEMRKKRVK